MLYTTYRYGNSGNGVVLSLMFSLFNYVVWWIGEFFEFSWGLNSMCPWCLNISVTRVLSDTIICFYGEISVEKTSDHPRARGYFKLGNVWECFCYSWLWIAIRIAGPQCILIQLQCEFSMFTNRLHITIDGVSCAQSALEYRHFVALDLTHLRAGLHVSREYQCNAYCRYEA